MAQEPKKEINIQVNDPKNLRAGSYSNVFSVTTTTAKEVIIDFVFTHVNDKSDDEKQLGTLVSRVVMPVDLAIGLKLALESQLGKHRKE